MTTKLLQRIAIIGGAGFIGTVLAKRLHEDGHEIILIDLNQSEAFPDKSVIADVTDLSELTSALSGVDVIYNLAAEHRDDVSPVSKYYDVNVGGAENIIKAAEANGIKTIVFTSTVAVYPLKPANLQTGSRETDPPAPFNDYGKSKLEAEVVLKRWAEQGEGRTLVIDRLVATFGPNNRGNIYTLMSQIAGGKFAMIGNGQNRKSIAYVGNVAAFLAHALTFQPGTHLYNYADKPDLVTRDLVSTIRQALGMQGMGPRLPYPLGLIGGMGFDVMAKLTGRTFPISAVRVRKFCANTIVSADKLEETGFQRKYSLEDGLREMIEAEFLHNKGTS